MRLIRFSLAGMMVVVLIVALGLVALRSASPMWAGIALLGTCGILGLALIGVICRGGAERAWWLGWTLFGWGYLALALWSPPNARNLPTVSGLEAIWTKIGMEVPGVTPGSSTLGGTDPSFVQIGHCLCALIGASLGGILASVLFAVPAFRRDGMASELPTRENFPRRWWRRPVVVGLSGLAVAGLTAVIGSRLAPPLWAGASFLLTCALLAIVAVGALTGRGRSREICIAATVFGWGYMILAFGWHPFHSACPYLVTGRFLNLIRPTFPPEVGGFPPCDDRTEPANARILKLLDKRVPIRFPSPTPLEDLLKHVKEATSALDAKGIPIFVDPIGLQEAEKSMTSTVTLDAEDVPLKHSLKFCLRQLGLEYRVKDGWLQITCDGENEADLLPISEDPFVIVGHSLLALVAAGLGGIVGPIVAGPREGR